MGWRDRFQRKNHRHAPESPIALPIGAFGHREVILTLKREPGEAPESFPEEPINLIKMIVCVRKERLGGNARQYDGVRATNEWARRAIWNVFGA
jgi:hypothetical protein